MAREVLAPANRRAAVKRAEALADVIRAKQAEGKGYRTIAAELNAENVPTPRGGQWHLASVQRVISRLAS